MKGEKILEYLIKSVVTSEDITDYEEEEKLGNRPKLKIYYVESSVQPYEINTILYDSTNKSIKIRNLLTDYNIEILKKENPFWLIIFKDKKYQEDNYFLIRVYNSYWEIFTLSYHNIVERTLQKVIDVSDKIDPVWISRDSLVDIVSELVSESGIHGFTAKRRTLNFNKKVTIRVYGGDLKDIDLARKDFFCEPINIYFKQKNSPIDAIVGLISIDGYLRIDKIQPEAVDLFKKTKDELWSKYRRSYDTIVASVENLKKEIIRFNNEPIATRYNSFFSVTFAIDNPAYWDDNRIYNAIKTKFLENGNEYVGYTLGNNNLIYIFDLNFGGCFRLRLNQNEKKVIICPEENTTKKSMSKFCNNFLEHIEHSAKPEYLLEVFC